MRVVSFGSVLEQNKEWMVLLALSCLFLNVNGETDVTVQMQKVKEKLFKNYDRNVRPTVNGTNTTEVYLTYIPYQILGFNEETSIFTLDAWLHMSWIDRRLKWDKSEYDGFIQLPYDLLWVPDISVHNSHSKAWAPLQSALVSMESSGRVHWTPPLTTETSCPTTDTLYPQETECVIVLGSWSHDGWEIDYTDIWIFEDEFLNIHPRWDAIVNKMDAKRNVTVFSCCPEPYISLHIHIPLRRRPDPAIEATRTPCILIIILNLSIFWLPSESSKKLILGGFLFLSLVALMIYVAWNTKNPLAVLNSVSFLRTTMYLVVTTLLLQVSIVTKVSYLRGPSRPPPSLMQWLNSNLGKILCLKSPVSNDTLPLDRMQLKEDSSTLESLTANDEWKIVAAAIDRVLFLIMGITSIAVHHM